MSTSVPNSPTDDFRDGPPKKPSKNRLDKDLRPEVEQNAGAGAGASANISDCEDDAKETQEIAEAEGGEWIVMDMCDENGELNSLSRYVFGILR
jgi:hypothetical protein